MLKELANQINEVKKELEVILERKENLRSELAKLEVEKDDIKLELERKEKNQRDALVPEIERYRLMITEIQLGIVNNDKTIAAETEKNQDMNK